MKFFLPSAKSEAQAESVYLCIKRSISERYPNKLKEARIRSIRFNRNGLETANTVGELLPSNGKVVIAIFRVGRMYLVYTPGQGVVESESICIGSWHVKHIELFDRPRKKRPVMSAT